MIENQQRDLHISTHHKRLSQLVCCHDSIVESSKDDATRHFLAWIKCARSSQKWVDNTFSIMKVRYCNNQILCMVWYRAFSSKPTHEEHTSIYGRVSTGRNPVRTPALPQPSPAITRHHLPSRETHTISPA